MLSDLTPIKPAPPREGNRSDRNKPEGAPPNDRFRKVMKDGNSSTKEDQEHDALNAEERDEPSLFDLSKSAKTKGKPPSSGKSSSKESSSSQSTSTPSKPTQDQDSEQELNPALPEETEGDEYQPSLEEVMEGGGQAKTPQTGVIKKPVEQPQGNKKPLEQSKEGQKPIEQPEGNKKPIIQPQTNKKPLEQPEEGKKPTEQPQIGKKILDQPEGSKKTPEQPRTTGKKSLEESKTDKKSPDQSQVGKKMMDQPPPIKQPVEQPETMDSFDQQQAASALPRPQIKGSEEKESPFESQMAKQKGQKQEPGQVQEPKSEAKADILRQQQAASSPRLQKLKGSDEESSSETGHISKKQKTGKGEGSKSEEATEAKGDTSGILNVNIQSVGYQTEKAEELKETARSSSLIKDLANQMVDRIQIMRRDNETQTIITLRNPPILEGATITLTASDHAKRELSIAFANLSPEAKLLLDRRLKEESLTETLERKGITVHTLTTSTHAESPLYATNADQTSRDRQDQQRGQQQQQQRQRQGSQEPEDEEVT